MPDAAAADAVAAAAVAALSVSFFVFSASLAVTSACITSARDRLSVTLTGPLAAAACSVCFKMWEVGEGE